MSWFYNLTVFKKLLLAFSIIILLVIGLSSFSVYQLFKVNKASTDIATNWLPSIKAIDNVKLSLARVRASEFRYVFAKDEKELINVIEDGNKKVEILKKQQKEYEKLISEESEKVLYAKLQPKMEEFLQDYEASISLIKSSKKEELINLLSTSYFNKYTAMLKEWEQLSDINENGASQSDKLANQIYHSSFVLTISLVVLCIIILILMALGIASIIAKPLNKAVNFANNIANGDLSQSIEVKYNDETGKLMLALKMMNDNLKNIVNEVHLGVDTIATASSEISSGNMDLSNRTEDQASSLEETASAMEELSATVKNNSDTVQKVKEMTLNASELAKDSGITVNNLVQTMNEISEASNKIVSIISVIDNIAFQTNILALNAAVEAARAGEQGRGFAVVASEVRNLSKKSADAAKEIKELINASVNKVDTGKTLVEKAGNSMKDVVSSVTNVTGIIGEIASASQEQANGIGEVNKAISLMDQVTQQNAALVEEAAAASMSLQEQATKLSEIVNVFKTK